MTAPHSLSLPLDGQLSASLQAAAAWRGVSVEAYAGSAVAAAVRADAELADFVQAGTDSADRGELIAQDDIEAWFDVRHRPAAAE